MQHLNQLTEEQLCGLGNARQEGKDILPRLVVCPLGAVCHEKKKSKRLFSTRRVHQEAFSFSL